MSIFVYIFVRIYTHFYWGIYLEMELLNLTECVYIQLHRYCQIIFKVIVSFYTPISRV